MNTKTKLTGCVSCASDENTHGMQCAKCHCVSLVMSAIHSNWDHRDLEGLAKEMRSTNIVDFTATARSRGAFLAARLGSRIIDLAPIANMAPDALKQRVTSEMDRHRGEMEGIWEWERKNNKPGEYMKQAKAAILSWFGKTTESANERKN
jgi:hypothetical protein